ncbi:hypothetical protein Tco_1250136 [Tanacetum coccineum]
MAISSSSSSSSSDNKVQNCSKQCLESFKTLQKNFDSEREKHNRAKLEIQGYELALESLESRILGHEKNEMAWGEKYEFQNYDLKCREIKINNLKTELEKVVKERDELKDKIAKWEESSKNLDEILNMGIVCVFDGRSSDEESTLANDRSSKADGYKAVPPPITGNFLTPRADISFAGLDEYAIRNKIIESQTTELNTKTSETVGKTNDANTEKPKSVSESVVSNPKINKDSVIIEDWNSDDEEEGYEVQTVRPETQTVKTRDDKSGQTSQKQGIGFKKVKACFVCKSTDHLIKDCNFHDKKSQEPKLKNVINIGQREGKPVWDNTKRVNHQNFSKYPHLSKTFVPSGVLTRIGFVSTARPVCTARPSISTARPIYASRPIYPRMDNVRPRGSCSPIKRVKNMTTAGTRAVVNTGKGKVDIDLKKSRWVWRPKGNYLDHVSKDSGSFMLKKVEYVDPKGISMSVMLLSFMRPFGCPLTILNTLDVLGKFDGKSDEGYLLGYSTTSKAFRVYNKRTKRVEENLYIDFLEDQPNVPGTSTQDSYVAGSSRKDKGPTQEYILLPLQPHRTRIPVEDVASAAHENL